jgi:putative membrane protein
MELFLLWLMTAAAVVIVAYLLPGVRVSGFGSALWAAVALGVVNVVIRPLLLFLALPINILTLGLFTFVINALIILLVAALVPGFQVSNFWWALLFSIILSIVVSLLSGLVY